MTASPGTISLQSGVEEDFDSDSIDESEIYCVNYLENIDAWQAIEQMSPFIYGVGRTGETHLVGLVKHTCYVA